MTTKAEVTIFWQKETISDLRKKLDIAYKSFGRFMLVVFIIWFLTIWFTTSRISDLEGTIDCMQDFYESEECQKHNCYVFLDDYEIDYMYSED